MKPTQVSKPLQQSAFKAGATASCAAAATTAMPSEFQISFTQARTTRKDYDRRASAATAGRCDLSHQCGQLRPAERVSGQVSASKLAQRRSRKIVRDMLAALRC